MFDALHSIAYGTNHLVMNSVLINTTTYMILALGSFKYDMMISHISIMRLRHERGTCAVMVSNEYRTSATKVPYEYFTSSMYTSIIRVLNECYTSVIRVLYECYTSVTQVPYTRKNITGLNRPVGLTGFK